MRILRIVSAVVLLAAVPAHAFDLDFNKLAGMAKKLKVLKPLSDQEEVNLGQGIAANILGAAPLVQDTALETYVNRVGRWLALHTDRPDLPWRFGVLDTDTVNAFATPGGYVFITRGLLARLHDESELAGVLAHEISHVVARHALKTMRKDALLGVAGEAAGDALAEKHGEAYRKLVSAGTEVYTRGLDKDDEFAADRMGAVIAARAGYDPYGLAAVLQTLASINPKDNAVALMFKTHPAPERRLTLLLEATDEPLANYADQPKVAGRFAHEMRAASAPSVRPVAVHPTAGASR